MCEKPLRNSKGADKPFRSPFANVSISQQSEIKNNANTTLIGRLCQYGLKKKFNSPISTSTSQSNRVKNIYETQIVASTSFTADDNKNIPMDITVLSTLKDNMTTSVGALENKKEEGDASNLRSNNLNRGFKPLVSKRLIFQEEPSPKRQCIHDSSQENVADQQNIKLFQSDLEALKKRIRDKQQHIGDIKRRLLYCKKHKVEDLEAAIEKWTNVCQTILEDYRKIAEERCYEPVSMEQILTTFGINPDLVRFSVEEEMFVQ